jgi:hypothetical protein
MNKNKVFSIAGAVVLGLAASLLAACGPAQYLSSSFGYQGVLTDSGGNPVPDSGYEVAFRLYGTASGGDSVYAVTKTVTTTNGIFSTVLSPPVEEMDNPLYLDLTVEGEQLPERQRLLGAPYALSLVGGATVDGLINQGSAVSATLNVANYGTGAGLAVVQSNTGTDPDSAIIGGNYNVGDDIPTLKLTNQASDGRMIEAYNGDGAGGNPWNDIEFSVRGNGSVYCDGSFVDTGGDYADMLPVAESVEPGDVLVIGPDGRMVASTSPRATNVAGVHSTKPGFIGGDPTANPDEGDPEVKALMDSLPALVRDPELERVPVAMAGVVPCKVSAENGAIQPGDLLVTSNTTGHAMRADAPEPGTLLGKAMEPLESGTGVILVLVSLN